MLHSLARSSLTRRIRRILPAALSLMASIGLVGGVLAVSMAPQAAAAGSFTQVTGFGSNPCNLAMYSYVPSGLPSGAPLVVALHGCTQNASDYYSHSGWPKYADQWRFAMVFPQ